MKFIVVTHEYAPFYGGAAIYCQELAGALEQAGEAVEVWYPATPGRLRWRPLAGFAWQIWRRRQALRDARVILGSSGAHMVFMMLRPRCGELISLLHGSEILRFAHQFVWRRLAPGLWRRVTRIVVPSRFTQSLVERQIPGREVVVAPCACSRAAAQPAAHDGHDEIRVLTLARMHPRKGQLDTARALALLPEQLKQRVVFQVAGTGDNDYLRQVREVCTAGQVRLQYLGRIEDAQLAATYAQCDIFCMPSRSLPTSVEGFGISYLEAGWHGKPVVAYRTGGVTEAVVDEVTGLLANEGDVAGLARRLGRLLEDPRLRARLGIAGQEQARRFSWAAAARAFQR